MFVEDSNASKIGVKLFSFCAYHSEKARSVRIGMNKTVCCDEFVLAQLNVTKTNTALECYENSQLYKLENSFASFVNWQELAEDLEMPIDVMESIFNHWVRRRTLNHNRPLLDLCEANEVYLMSRFKETDIRPLVIKKQVQEKMEEDWKFMVKEYAHAQTILDKRRNLASLTLRREKLKLQIVSSLKDAFEEITAPLDSDSPLSLRFLEKMCEALAEQYGHGRTASEICD